ncbi:galactarate dehydratase [Alkalihalophilus marmarensis]|uniref:Galactarate dehydratase n=1 Tax=Alkalihalophilus marmarensis DSM 21297 TaxID=1188261 RepID=U6SPP9_9BACI|nr:galactarate dehydratase [Alkalihalophilus marmarensis]ERN53598.1 hypothetical protein A33I_10340 [Alkalihalophilus marmarensis DSM 21297]MCM3490189.1 galactarate dehydratase [Alkalihalophilus marmarensis]
MDVHTKVDDIPLYIKVHENDNVAIIVNSGGLKQGTAFTCGLELIEFVPQGHKVALFDIEQNQPIIRYGEIIGYALSSIPTGSWVKESLIDLPKPPDLDHLTIASRKNEPLPPLDGYTFEGYRNTNGTAGIKNILGITTSVQCVTGVLDYAVEKIKKDILPQYPNVHDVVALNHAYGCGVAIGAPEAKIPIRTIQHIAVHPNFGGEVLVVGLGCEKLVPDQLSGPSNILSLQQQPGFEAMVSEICRMAEVRLEKLNERRRETIPVKDLVVGLQCGGSDAFSGVTANPAIGYAADLLVRAGATVMFSEVTEVRDAIHLLTERAVNEEVGRSLIQEMKWYDAYLEKGEADRSANPSPGNKKGGLSNVVEKSLGSVVKSGTSPISGVIPPGERATEKGLLFAATPASDFVCGTLQLAAGMHLQVFATGRGTPYNLSMAPVIKVSTRNSLMEEWKDLIDINAGTIATGEATIEEVGWELFHFILDVASGRKQTWADQWGISNDLTLFNPAPIT